MWRALGALTMKTLTLLALVLPLMSQCVDRRSLLTSVPTLPTAAGERGGDLTVAARGTSAVGTRQSGAEELVILSPQWSLDAAGTLRLNEVVALRPTMQLGLAQRAMSGSGDIARQGHPSFLAGLGLLFRAELDGAETLLDVEVDPLLGFVVEREERCTVRFTYCALVSQERHFTLAPRGAARVSHAVAPWLRGYVAAGLAFQPTGLDVGEGTFVAILGGGLVASIGPAFRVGLDVQWPFVGSAPFTYAPTVGGFLRFDWELED